MEIIKGKKPGAVRAIISGTEGIGKSTLAAQIPGALIIDTEDGTSQIDCARVLALDWRAIESALKELIADQQGFRAVVIDSADWLERSLTEWMLKTNGKKSIEDYGYGKGYTMLMEHFSRFLALADQLIAKGIHVAFVAHTKTVRVSPPDQTDGFDRYELKLSKQVAPLLKEWSDLYLFANYRIQIVEGNDGRLKAQGGKERIMYANRCAAWDAKNRYGLPDEMPMEFARIAHIFEGAAPRSIQATKPAPVAAHKPAAAKEEATQPSLATTEQIDRLNALKQTKEGSEQIEAELERINAVGVDELTNEQAAELIASIESVASMESGVIPAEIAEWLSANEEKVNAYLSKIGWLADGLTWRDATPARIALIIDGAARFAKKAGIHAPGKAAA